MILKKEHKRRTYTPIPIATRKTAGLTLNSSDLDLLTCIHGT